MFLQWEPLRIWIGSIPNKRAVVLFSAPRSSNAWLRSRQKMSTNEKNGFTIEVEKRKVSVTEEVYRAYKGPLWKEHKRQERERRCFLGTHRCMANCEECPKYHAWMDTYGDPYSIEKMDADGLEIQDDYSLEDEVIHRMLNEALHNAVDELPQVDREIIILYANKVGTREIAKKVHMPQSTVSYREKIIIKQLRNKLKDWK